ncbi:hypothetical protein J2Y66_001136 [Paenarthrobacter nitroguajacolicus]|uniref:hypothetical protein n=1 Tax=Paenarthrobacter nitroguajacolicus TaxID=211146 RepID=UPI00285688E2|nr:hypothetical protein [Paenarthrobacter nitroguajacolicus]MDR6986666.1 hypothetical protein [Paenarthrobacter nitroguajacolicus]
MQTSSRKPLLAVAASILVISTLGGCSAGTAAPAENPGTAAARSTPPSSTERSGTATSPQAESTAGNSSAEGKLDPATESLTWENGKRILGDENGGHTPDIASSLTDPNAGWQADYSRMATDGMMTFTSDSTQCKVRTIQVRNQPSELVPGDDRESTLKVLAILIPGKPDLAANVKDATLGYGMAGNRGVDMLSLTYTSGDSYGYTAVRTFSKPAVTVKVEALCPTVETLKTTLDEIGNNISINAR